MKKMSLTLVALILVTLNLNPLSSLAASPPKPQDEVIRDLSWLEKNRDPQGCIRLEKVAEPAQPKTCPEKIELQIRPLTLGQLRKNSPAQICCYNWKTYGNR